jgi:H+/Cl- antiporter ClcA
LLIGISTGFVCFLWTIGTEYLVVVKWEASQALLSNSTLNIMLAYLMYVGLSLVFGCASSILTLKVEPLAAGGGTTEMMGYFNGVNYPAVFSLKTLIVKVFGLMLAIASGLCIGKEGVLA